MRQLAAAVVTTAATWLAAMILGEYEMGGFTPYLSGVLFGLVIAEIAVSIAKPRPSLPVALVAVVLPALGMAYAVWISAGEDSAYITNGAWIGTDLAPLAAAIWLRQR